MVRRQLAAVAAVGMLALAACSGGGTHATTAALPPTTGVASASATTAPNASASPGGSSAALTLVRPTFVFGKVNAVTSSSTSRRPQYVTSAVASVTIQLTTVNGAAPTGSLATSATTTTSITPANCPCTVNGPPVPAGTDGFLLTASDASNAVIATASPTYTIVAGQPNAETVTMNGVPASLSVAVPAASAGTAFATPQAVSIDAKDVDGNVIMGAYAAPVTLADADTSGATALATSGTDNPSSSQLLSSSDVATLAYNGLAMAPVAITATASGATSGSTNFAPALQPIVVANAADTINPNAAGIDLTSSTSSGSVTLSEAGWTDHGKTLTATAGTGCATIGTLAQSGNTLTATAVGSPTAGSCTITVNDTLGQQASAALAYTTYGFSGAPQTVSLPAFAAHVSILATGGGGGPISNGGSTAGSGFGATVSLVSVAAPTATLTVTVGGQGVTGSGTTGGAGGYPNGGAGGTGPYASLGGGGGGGGATTIASGATVLVVAGGGGGGSGATPNGGVGSGGTPNASTTGSPQSGSAGDGGGATQGAPGAGGAAATFSGSGTVAGAAGSGGTGGAGGGNSVANGVGGGGGGGGYFGGGGGGENTDWYAGNGGGGSSYALPSLGTPTYARASSVTSGSATITW